MTDFEYTPTELSADLFEKKYRVLWEGMTKPGRGRAGKAKKIIRNMRELEARVERMQSLLLELDGHPELVSEDVQTRLMAQDYVELGRILRTIQAWKGRFKQYDV